MSDLFALETVGWVEVAVDAAIDAMGRGLHYAIDPELATLAPGDPVKVPLGRGDLPVLGWVVDRLEAPPPDAPATLKHVIERVDELPTLPTDTITLARWMAGYYMTPLGPTLAATLPPKGSPTGAPRQQRWVQPADALDEAAVSKLGPLQRDVVHYLQQLPASQLPVERLDLVRRLELKDAGSIDRLINRGVLEAVAAPDDDPPAGPIRPTEAQQQIVEAIGADLGTGFAAHLLFGVTGSGKTEVYLQLMRRCLDRGEVAMVLVPEIMLTPQTQRRIERRFPDARVAVMHSGVRPSKRRAAWNAVATGDIDIIVGARSAVLAPVHHAQLGLVIVDEEHDSSYRQDSNPRYHGRDVALRLGQLARCPVVLGSATPSLESWWNATKAGRYRLHTLRERAPGLHRPKVRIVDRMDERRRAEQRGALGPTLQSALSDTLLSGGQALLLLNRRGWATHVTCTSRTCGWVMRCDACDASLVFHRKRNLHAGGSLRCHHCLASLKMPRTCPSCSGALARLGEGSQRLEDEIARLHPDLVQDEQLVRLDVDSRGSADNVSRVMQQLRVGAIRVLVGTQMIAKGLDLPGVTLVGVVDADTALHVPDFRAAERTFQLVAQVAGRCGRGSSPGQVVIQTNMADDPAIALAAAERFEAFADLELEQREAVQLPPARRMARVVMTHDDLDTVRNEAQAMARRLEAADDRWQVSPAAPCPLARVAGRYRWQVEVLAENGAALHKGLVHARAQQAFARFRDTLVDVDPLHLQ